MELKLGLLDQVWDKACSIPGMDPHLFRRDEQGSLICKNDYNNESSIYGWCVHHLIPLWEGGCSDLGNSTPLNCTNKLLTLADSLRRLNPVDQIWD